MSTDYILYSCSSLEYDEWLQTRMNIVEVKRDICFEQWNGPEQVSWMNYLISYDNFRIPKEGDETGKQNRSSIVGNQKEIVNDFKIVEAIGTLDGINIDINEGMMSNIPIVQLENGKENINEWMDEFIETEILMRQIPQESI